MRSLRIQLLVSHLLLVLLMAAVTGSAIYSFLTLGQAAGVDMAANIRAVRGVGLLDAALLQQRTALWLLQAGAPSQAMDTYASSWSDFNAGERLVKGASQETGIPGLAWELSEDAGAYRQIADHVMASNQIAIQGSTKRVVMQILEPRLASMLQLTQSMRREARGAILQENQTARADAAAAIRRAMFVTVVALILAILLGARMVKTVVTPLSTLARRAGQIASGDLAPRQASRRGDEIGELSESFEAMAASISESRRVNLRRLQRAEQMSDAALEYLYDPVVVVDHKGFIVHLNRAAQELLGALPNEARLPVKEHVKDRRLQLALEKIALRPEISAPEDESSLLSLSQDGVSRTYRIRATPLQDTEGRPLGSVAVLEDVTHLKELDRLKTEFIGVASHELRTPVSSLLLAAQLLEEGAVGELNAQQHEIVRTQLEDLTRLEKLMRDLLDVTKLESGAAKIRPIPLAANKLLKSAGEPLQSQATIKGVTLVVDEATTDEVLVDPAAISRVITNLTANAIRHTGSGGTVRLSASATPDEVIFTVEDTGEGIPKEYLERIFDRFVQVPGATQGGAGLGLSIAQNIVRAHRGRLWVESEVGKGSAFRFAIPKQAQAPGGDMTA